MWWMSVGFFGSWWLTLFIHLFITHLLLIGKYETRSSYVANFCIFSPLLVDRKVQRVLDE